MLKKLNSSIFSFMSDPSLSMAAIVAIGEMARNGRLLFVSREAKLNTVEVLIKKIQTSKETNKLKEKAAATLGYICIHEMKESGAEMGNCYLKKKFNYQIHNQLFLYWIFGIINWVKKTIFNYYYQWSMTNDQLIRQKNVAINICTAGHIFSLKRRKSSLSIFTKLVFLKLNQEFL